jgi:hypothetical protein
LSDGLHTVCRQAVFGLPDVEAVLGDGFLGIQTKCDLAPEQSRETALMRATADNLNRLMRIIFSTRLGSCQRLFVSIAVAALSQLLLIITSILTSMRLSLATRSRIISPEITSLRLRSRIDRLRPQQITAIPSIQRRSFEVGLHWVLSGGKDTARAGAQAKQ